MTRPAEAAYSFEVWHRPPDRLALPVVEFEAVEGEPGDKVRSGIKVDQTGAPVAYGIASASQPSQPVPHSLLDGRSGGAGLAPMRDDLAVQGMPGDRVGDDDRGSLGSDEHAQRELNAVARPGPVLDLVPALNVAGGPLPKRLYAFEDAQGSGVVLVVGHARETLTPPPARQAPRGGHTELTIARFLHEDARIRGGGELPAVWSAYG